MVDTESKVVRDGAIRTVGTVGTIPPDIDNSYARRKDLAEAVETMAYRLSNRFKSHRVEIRFNDLKLGGGAWLVDTEENTQVGVGAKLVPPTWHEILRERALFTDEIGSSEVPGLGQLNEEEFNLQYTVKIEPPAVREQYCNRVRHQENQYFVGEYYTPEGAWGKLDRLLIEEEVNPPA